MIALKNHDERSIKPFASNRVSGYRSAVAANSAAGFGDPNRDKGATAPSSRLQALFLRPQFRVMAAVRGVPSGTPGSFVPGSPTCVQLPPYRLATKAAAPTDKGATPMRYILTLSPSKARAAAHRAMAMAALRSKSSLSVRLKRYNAHMATARRLDGGAA